MIDLTGQPVDTVDAIFYLYAAAVQNDICQTFDKPLKC